MPWNEVIPMLSDEWYGLPENYTTEKPYSNRQVTSSPYPWHGPRDLMSRNEVIPMLSDEWYGLPENYTTEKPLFKGVLDFNLQPHPLGSNAME